MKNLRVFTIFLATISNQSVIANPNLPNEVPAHGQIRGASLENSALNTWIQRALQLAINNSTDIQAETLLPAEATGFNFRVVGSQLTVQRIERSTRSLPYEGLLNNCNAHESNQTIIFREPTGFSKHFALSIVSSVRFQRPTILALRENFTHPFSVGTSPFYIVHGNAPATRTQSTAPTCFGRSSPSITIDTLHSCALAPTGEFVREIRTDIPARSRIEAASSQNIERVFFSGYIRVDADIRVERVRGPYTYSQSLLNGWAGIQEIQELMRFPVNGYLEVVQPRYELTISPARPATCQ